ncbi:hypothetical protein RN001_011040 [Aquatica leii]|uniref:Uncharacterized protein n=1 Tax=Aquatica leii TaxID=1421715 RepID=A0AAN7SGF4_9COLE|nr:hypothetical protein RN001_011040 [Aquatica leii]
MLQFKLLNFLPKIDLKITPNPIACNRYEIAETEQYYFLNDGNDFKLQSQLLYVLPEIDLNITPNPVACRDFFSENELIVELRGDNIKISKNESNDDVKGCTYRNESDSNDILNVNHIAEGERDELKFGNIADCKSKQAVVAIYDKYINEFGSYEKSSEVEMNIRVNTDRPIAFGPRRISFRDREKLQLLLGPRCQHQLNDAIRTRIQRDDENSKNWPVTLKPFHEQDPLDNSLLKPK